MSLNQVTGEIIKNSIRSAICIDNEYASAYCKPEDIEKYKLNFDEPAKLYASFREDGHCDLDVYQFVDLDTSWKQYMLSNKDLMILDWELDSGQKYDSTLHILKEVIESRKIPFVVIYTNTEDLDSVTKAIIKNFNPITVTNREEILEKLRNKFKRLSDLGDDVPVEEFFDDHENDFYEFFKFYAPAQRAETKDRIIKSFVEKLDIKDNVKDRVETYIEGLLAAESTSSDAFMNLCLAGLSDNRNGSSYPIERIEISNHAIRINGVLLLVYHKSSQGDGIKPEKLFETFSEAIINNPHNYLNVLSLEIKDNLREQFSSIGTKFAQVDERAFLFHANNYRNEDGKFNTASINSFIIKSWVWELEHLKSDTIPTSLAYIGERYSEYEKEFNGINQESKELLSDIVKYASYVSNSVIKNETRALRFGDLFINEPNEFFLCITPHCDCVRPQEKLKNNFYFIKGSIDEDDHNALQKAENGFYSFIHFNNKTYSIKWRCKPFTLYIANNNVGQLNIDYCGVSKSVKYVATLKENYAQRIANESFGYGYRVGIDLPHIKSSECELDD